MGVSCLTSDRREPSYYSSDTGLYIFLTIMLHICSWDSSSPRLSHWLLLILEKNKNGILCLHVYMYVYMQCDWKCGWSASFLHGVLEVSAHCNTDQYIVGLSDTSFSHISVQPIMCEPKTFWQFWSTLQLPKMSDLVKGGCCGYKKFKYLVD